MDGEDNLVFVKAGLDLYFASRAGKGLVCILEKVKEGLLELIGIETKGGQVICEVEMNPYIVFLELGSKESEGIL